MKIGNYSFDILQFIKTQQDAIKWWSSARLSITSSVLASISSIASAALSTTKGRSISSIISSIVNYCSFRLL